MALGGSNLTASAIDEMSLDDIAEFELAELRSLQAEIDTAEALWKARKDGLQAALDIKYGAKATALRLAKQQDTGTVHIIEGGLDVTCELKKKVEWDQPKLEALWQRIATAKDDPKVYIKQALSVSETAYAGWPANIQEPFKPARTVKPDKPKYTIKEAKP